MTDALLGLPLPDAELESELAAGLAQVEAGLQEAVASDDPFVAEASRYLVDAGGKRFRPLLVLLAAQFGDPQAWGVVPAGVVVELTHLATLYHDDVMDEAPAAPRCPVGERPLGQHDRHPHGRLPVRALLAHPRRPRPGGGPHPGPHVRAAVHGPDPRDGRPP